MQNPPDTESRSRRPRPVHNWRSVAIGVVGALLLAGFAWLTPRRASATDSAVEGAARSIHRALVRHDRGALDRARSSLRRVAHRAALSHRVPALLRLIDALEGPERRCLSAPADAFHRGICALRATRFEEALVAFAGVSNREGGEVYRDLAVRLMTLERRQSR